MRIPSFFVIGTLGVLAMSHVQADSDTQQNFDFSALDVEAEFNQISGSDRKWQYGPFSLGGFVKQTLAYSFEAEDVKTSQVKSALDVQLDMDFSDRIKGKAELLTAYDAAYALEGRDKFSSDTLAVYEADTRLQEAYLDMDVTSSFNLRLGRQYFSWGESEGKQISDIGNSRDYRELGLQQVDDARLSAGASKLTFYGSDWEYNLIAIHEFRAHEFGAEGSVYDPYLQIRRAGGVILEDKKPANTTLNPEVISRLYFSRSFGDISLFAGETYDDTPVFSIPAFTSDLRRVEFQPEYHKYLRYGAFGNVISGSWLFKYDLARSQNKPLIHSSTFIAEQIANGRSEVVGFSRADMQQAMLGVEYSGVSETFISLEFYWESISHYQEAIFQDEKSSREMSVYLSRDFLNDRLITTFWVNRLIGDATTMYRLDATYDLNDRLEVGLAFTGLLADDADSYFYDYRTTDRMVLTLRYSF